LAEPHKEWTVLPHGTLETLEDSILTVTGTANMPIGAFERRMTIVRQSDGTLILYSPVALDEAQMAQIEAFGAPAFLIIPGSHHRLDASTFKDRYPAAKVIAADGAAEDVEEVVPVEETSPAFSDSAVQFVVVPGTSRNEAALLVTAGGGVTLIVNDIIANLHHMSGFGGWIAKLFGFAGDKPQIPVPEKMSIIDDKKALASQFRQWADLPLKRIVVSHGEPVTERPGDVLREIAATLD